MCELYLLRKADMEYAVISVHCSFHNVLSSVGQRFMKCCRSTVNSTREIHILFVLVYFTCFRNCRGLERSWKEGYFKVQGTVRTFTWRV